MHGQADPLLRRILVIMALGFALILAAVLWAPAVKGKLEGQGGDARHKTRLVAAMRANLAVAVDAEKSAVLAATDAEAQQYVRQAKEARELVSQQLADYKRIPGLPGAETEQIARFERSYAEFRKVDDEVLGLAAQNTNTKARTIMLGPAAETLALMEKALTPLLSPQAGPGPGRLAVRALGEAWRIQALSAAHLAEPTEARKQELEEQMGKADKQARASLSGLGGQKAGADAVLAYETFRMAGEQIVKLSRQNTGLRAQALSLEHGTRLLGVCDAALRALGDAVYEGMAAKGK